MGNATYAQRARTAWFRRALTACHRAGGTGHFFIKHFHKELIDVLARNHLHIVYDPPTSVEDLPMALTTLTLEIRNDFDDPIKHEAMREAVKIAARDLIATATLLQERQVPEINLYENTMEGSTEVNLLEEASNPEG